MGFISDIWEGITGETAAEAAREAAGTQVAGQREALEYLKERERIPMALREQAITQLGGLYGLPGIAPEEGVPGVPGREEFIAGLREDPFYEQLRGAGEEAVLRGRAATGGLRAGGTQEALAAQNQALLRGLYQQRVGGLAGLAGLPTYAPQIAGVMGGMGETRAAGITGAAQAKQQALENMMNIGMKVAGMMI